MTIGTTPGLPCPIQATYKGSTSLERPPGQLPYEGRTALERPLPLKQSTMFIRVCSARQDPLTLGMTPGLPCPVRIGGRGASGTSQALVVQRAFWKRSSTAWRYMCLMHGVVPGSESQKRVKRISEKQIRYINEYPLSEQSKSRAAFGNNPLL